MAATETLSLIGHQSRVSLFMDLAKQDRPSVPTEPTEKVAKLRAALILEEALETIDALGFDIICGNQIVETEYAAKLVPHGKGVDLVEVADGCADISVVTIGTLIACGINAEPIYMEVDESNLRKFNKGYSLREDGKLLKPKDWKPPRILQKLKEQGYGRSDIGQTKEGIEKVE